MHERALVKWSFLNGAFVKWGHSQMGHWSNGVIHEWALVTWGHSQMGHWLNDIIYQWGISQMGSFMNGALAKWGHSQVSMVEWSDLLMHNSLKFSCLLFTSASCTHQTKKETAGSACVWRRSRSAAAAGRLHEAAREQFTHLCGLTIKTKLIATHQK